MTKKITPNLQILMYLCVCVEKVTFFKFKYKESYPVYTFCMTALTKPLYI